MSGTGDTLDGREESERSLTRMMSCSESFLSDHQDGFREGITLTEAQLEAETLSGIEVGIAQSRPCTNSLAETSICDSSNQNPELGLYLVLSDIRVLAVVVLDNFSCDLSLARSASRTKNPMHLRDSTYSPRSTVLKTRMVARKHASNYRKHE